ncbi:uncharacterized protein brk [Euwallacea fornicatus]|uniref:uncharacterized protein brk n=1 Tax=Euwallacea fornicatus TaxID=995702 RepID=UPI00338DBC58
MAHGLNSVIKRAVGAVQCKPEGKTGVGSRRIFSPQFKLQVLDSYRNDADCKGNQRATARKYGIHRRQIQKWLQVESTLRSGVNGKHHQPSNQTVKSEMSLSGHRQRDDETRSASLASEARVPSLEPPAGWPAHQPAPICVPDPATPMDLSLKRPPLSSPPAVVHLSVTGPLPSLSPRQPDDVWDLSTKTNKRKAEGDDVPSKPVKLFKPYLDILRDSDNESPPKPIVVTPSSPPMYCCQASPESYYLNNNNNFCCDILKSPEYHPAYNFHELHQRTRFYYGYYPEYHPELSPTYHPYEEPQLKHPYTIDCKVSAIDCYHPNALCKGNPRAVATKYHISRSAEDKWIGQEDLKHEVVVKEEPLR